jgi:hypothetical protein
MQQTQGSMLDRIKEGQLVQGPYNYGVNQPANPVLPEYTPSTTQAIKTQNTKRVTQ